MVKPSDAVTNTKVIQTIPLSLLPFDPEHILVMRNDRKRYQFDVYRMNIYSGKFKRLIAPPGPVVGWAADNDGVIRLAAMQDENSLNYETQIMYRDDDDSEWQEIDRFEGLQNGWGVTVLPKIIAKCMLLLILDRTHTRSAYLTLKRAQ